MSRESLCDYSAYILSDVCKSAILPIKVLINYSQKTS